MSQTYIPAALSVLKKAVIQFPAVVLDSSCLTPSMRPALKGFELDRIFVIYPVIFLSRSLIRFPLYQVLNLEKLSPEIDSDFDDVQAEETFYSQLIDISFHTKSCGLSEDWGAFLKKRL